MARFGRTKIRCGVAGWLLALISAAQAQDAVSPAAPVKASPAAAGQTTVLVETEAAAGETGDSAVQSGPRALARAFRNAAAKTTPCVVTVFAYGQEQRGASASNNDSPTRPRNPLGRGLPDPQQSFDEELGPNRPDMPEDEPSVGPTPPPLTDDAGRNVPFSGLGSGVIVSADGLIITNNHVIANAQRLMVQTFDQTELEVTRVFGDPKSDLAVLKVEAAEPLAAATLGDSDGLEIGDWVLAIGSPFELEATVSAGIISAKNRALRSIRRGRMLQTDAAINPGNSGGPLIDLNGDVIGINTAIATRGVGYMGIGFAIPINHARWIADELANHGAVRRAALGLRLADLNNRIAARVGLPAGLGVLVYQVIDKSAAAQAGIQPLDVIIEFAGERVKLASDLQETVERMPIGSTQPVKIVREGKEISLEVLLAPIEDPTATKAPAEDEPATELPGEDKSE
jgi:serine protease Do